MSNKPCSHESGIEAYTTGGMHFNHETGPWDDICLHGLCVDCGKHIDCQSCCKDMEQQEESDG